MSFPGCQPESFIRLHQYIAKAISRASHTEMAEKVQPTFPDTNANALTAMNTNNNHVYIHDDGG